MGISMFAAWKLADQARRVQFEAGSKLGKLAGAYVVWLQLLRWLIPGAIVLIMLHALGLLA
jgi:NSS family neurotransmitter:Na+ symporter